MKQIIVSSKCNGCGLCIVNSPYLQENEEGYAQPVPGKAIKDSDLQSITTTVNECPEKALSIIETGKATMPGRDGMMQIIEGLKKQCNALSVKTISSSDVAFREKDYSISIPVSNKEYRRDYPSESSAKKAAKDEFCRLCYSESAYRPLLRKIFVEYKVNVLRPYYTCEDIPESAYYQYNEIVRKQLADAYAEISAVLGEGKLSKAWTTFSVYPKTKDWLIKELKNFDERSIGSGIMSDFKSRGKYTSLSYYVDMIDYDYDEHYVGEGRFGQAKYKNVYYFSGLNAEIREFIDDLRSSIDNRSDYITDVAVELINPEFEIFEGELKKAFMSKIDELKKLLDTPEFHNSDTISNNA